MGISEWAATITGMPDTWTALQFDAAIIQFGTRIENMLEERDKEFKPIHKLEDLLRDDVRAGTQTTQNVIESMKAHGALGRRKWKRPQT